MTKEPETGRFIVENHAVDSRTVRRRVKDMLNGRFVRFGYNNPPLYATATKPATDWQSYYSARGFCQKLAARNDPLPWKLADKVSA